MNYTGFPSIKIGHFYRLQFKDARAVAFCASENRFVVKAGSTAAFDCPDVNDTENCKEFESNRVRDNMAIDDCIYQIVEGRLDIYNDYDKANPLEAAQAITGLDNIDPAVLWQEVFEN